MNPPPINKPLVSYQYVFKDACSIFITPNNDSKVKAINGLSTDIPVLGHIYSLRYTTIRDTRVH